MTTESSRAQLEALKQAIRAAEELVRRADDAMVELEAEPRERQRPPQPLARATLTVRLPDDESALVTIDVIVCDQNNWFRRPESNEGGWSCMSVGPLDVATRIIGF